jgi:hypothetical protein
MRERPLLAADAVKFLKNFSLRFSCERARTVAPSPALRASSPGGRGAQYAKYLRRSFRSFHANTFVADLQREATPKVVKLRRRYL